MAQPYRSPAAIAPGSCSAVVAAAEQLVVHCHCGLSLHFVVIVAAVAVAVPQMVKLKLLLTPYYLISRGRQNSVRIKLQLHKEITK